MRGRATAPTRSTTAPAPWSAVRPGVVTTSDLFATFADHGARATVPEAGATYNRGFMEFNLMACTGGCSLRMILRVPFEQYLLGIGEVPSSWPMEALRAQAIAARSFALYKIQTYGVQSTCNCHLTDGSNDQVYIGWDKEGGVDGKRWVNAVRSTAGQIVTYQGAVALTVFTASDGGHTEDLNVQWGTPLAAYPYLAGVCDPGDYTAANPWSDWNRQFSAQALTTALVAYTGDIGTVSPSAPSAGAYRAGSSMRSCGEPTATRRSPAVSSVRLFPSRMIACGSTPTRTCSETSARSTTP